MPDYKPLLFPLVLNPAAYTTMQLIYGFLQLAATRGAIEHCSVVFFVLNLAGAAAAITIIKTLAGRPRAEASRLLQAAKYHWLCTCDEEGWQRKGVHAPPTHTIPL